MNIFGRRFPLMEEVTDTGSGGPDPNVEIEPKPGDDVVALTDAVNRRLKQIRDQVESKFGAISKFEGSVKQIQENVEAAGKDILELKDRMDGIDTTINRVGVETVRDFKDKTAIAEEVLTHSTDVKYFKQHVGYKKDEFSGHVVIPYMKNWDDMTDEQKKISIAHDYCFWKYIRRGERGLLNNERDFLVNIKASVISDDQNAGYLLVPNVTVREILRDVTEFSPVRQFCDVKSGGAGAIEQIERESGITASWVAEDGTRSETTGPQFAVRKVEAWEMYVQLHATRQMIADAAYDLASMFAAEAGEGFGVLEGTAHISGNGVGQPWGIVDYDGNGDGTVDIGERDSGAGSIEADEIKQLPYRIKSPYLNNARWMWNRLAFALVAVLQAGDGHYLLRDGIGMKESLMLAGYPVSFATDLASSESANAIMALFGDFKRGYRIYDRQGIEMIRDPYNSKDTGTVEYDFYRRTGGKVLVPEALIQYKI